jgi:hypothetical protein
MFFTWLVLGKGGVDDLGREPAYSTDNAISVAMMRWNVGQSVFAVEQLFRNSDSVVTVHLSTISYFIYDLCNDAFSSSDNIALNDWLNTE